MGASSQPPTDEISRALEALHAIPPDLSRDEWVRAGMAAHSAGLSFDDFDAWSAGAPTYDPRAARDTWRSFKPGKGVGAGTLHRMAAEHGYSQPPTKSPKKGGRTPQARPIAPRTGAEPLLTFGIVRSPLLPNTRTSSKRLLKACLSMGCASCPPATRRASAVEAWPAHWWCRHTARLANCKVSN